MTPITIARAREPRSGERTAEVSLSVVGAAFVLGALAAHQAWLDRHILPSFFLPHRWYALIEAAIRGALGAIGLTLVIARRPAARAFAAHPAAFAYALLAAVLALAASEGVLRRVGMRPVE